MQATEYETYVTGVLVVGAGGAGLRAAIEIAENGGDVMIVGKEVMGAAHTCMAEGGLNVALQDVNPQNSPAIHFADTMQGGAGLNNQKLVDIFTRECPERVMDLERYGAIFDRAENGQIAQRFSGKQTHPHTIFVGDYTGQAIMAALVSQVRRLNIPYFDEHFVTRLFARDGQVCGALALDLKSGQFRLLRAGAVLLATGGGGQMYMVTTNAASNTADGYAIALRMGGELVDMEMIQFHPTGMVYPQSARGSLVTESVRGEGGILRNNLGERFMERYNPQRMELAGRDEVARAIYSEVQSGRGTANGGVHLDVSHIDAAIIEERLPKMLTQFLAVGVDIRKEPMEVHPSMHHFMGGVRINEWGESNVKGLFAAGEVTGGVHGGNRLGGNAVAECQVFGRRAALAAMRFAQQQSGLAPAVAQVRDQVDRIRSYLSDRADAVSPHEVKDRLRRTMWNKVGIIRDEHGLLQAQGELADLYSYMDRLGARGNRLAHNKDLLDCLELDNMLLVARTIVAGGLWRKESRGAHYRKDFPQQDEDMGRQNVLVRLGKDNEIVCRPTPIVELG